MIRYQNQPMPERPRIAVIANDALGNFVMATPLIALLRQERNPVSVDYFGGTRTRELQEASHLIDRSFELFGSDRTKLAALLHEAGSYDLVVNLEGTALAKVAAGILAEPSTLVAGPCIGTGGRGDLPFGDDDRANLWRDPNWVRESLPEEYPFLRSPFIAEIFCRLCYLEGPIPAYQVPQSEPGEDVPDVLIATAASLDAKLWPGEKWIAATRRLRELGYSVGLVGAAPKAQSALWKGGDAEGDIIREGGVRDLRGRFTLPQVVGALSKARTVLTLDNGILHLAVAAGAPTVGLFRHGIHRLWAPPSPNLAVLTPGEGREVTEISVKQVLAALEPLLG